MNGVPYDLVVVPLANAEDAERTGAAFAERFDGGTAVATYVVEKAGGAADAASVEQREAFARTVFDAFEDRLRETDVTIETRIAYGVDVAETILEVASDVGSEAIVVVPRGGSRWRQLLTGDVARKLINRTDRPVLILPGETK